MTDKYNFTLYNHLEFPIKLSPVPLEDIEAEFKLGDEIIIHPSNGERKFPKIHLEKDEIVIDANESKMVNAEITELDFYSIGLSSDNSIVQRLKIVDTESGIIAGYLSFMCSLFHLRPIMHFDSCTGYKISDQKFPFGVGGIHISVAKSIHPNFL